MLSPGLGWAWPLCRVFQEISPEALSLSFSPASRNEPNMTELASLQLPAPVFPGKRWLCKEQIQKLAWPGLDKNKPGSCLRVSAGSVIKSLCSEPWADLTPHPASNLNAAISPVSWPFTFLWGILHLSPSCSGCTIVRALSSSFTCLLPPSQTRSTHPSKLLGSFKLFCCPYASSVFVP